MRWRGREAASAGPELGRSPEVLPIDCAPLTQRPAQDRIARHQPFPHRSAWLELFERPAEGTLADEVDAQPESLGERSFYPFRRFFRVLEVAFEAAKAHPRALSVAESHDIEAVRR